MTIVSIATGAGRGMGLACAERLAATSDVLVAVDRDEVTLGEAVPALGALGASVVPVTLDVTDAAALAALADQVRGLGSLGGVAHAAGISPTMADWRAVLSVDLVGTALLVEALTPLVTDGTAMVCFASMAAHLMASMADPAADAALDDPLAPDLLDRLHAALGESIEDPGVAYGQAKRGVQRLVRRTAIAWGPNGGRINSMSPGLIDTPIYGEGEGSEAFKAKLGESVLFPHRLGSPDELASMVVELVTNSYMNAEVVRVDGGIRMPPK